jgi:hypothetical protein
VPLSLGARIEFEELMKVRIELEEQDVEEVILLIKRLTDVLERVEEFIEEEDGDGEEGT